MMRINPQISIDLTKTGIQTFALADTDSLWVPIRYLNGQNVVTPNPIDASVAIWINDANSQPLLVGQAAGSCRSVSGSAMKQILVLALIPGVNVNSGNPGANQLVLGCGKCVRATFSDALGTVGPLYL
jgi:hypothetical protein